MHEVAILERTPDTPKKKRPCRCRCGNIFYARPYDIRSGNVKSCGCAWRSSELRRATAKSQGEANKKHGHRGSGSCQSPTYRTWISMRSRCRSESDPNWPAYGGRGIRVCERWETFENFLADMGERPAGTTIDRENRAGNYEPGNCRWATAKQQNQNRSKRHDVTWQGRTQTIAAWADELGHTRQSLLWRVNNMPLDRAMQPKGVKP